MDVFRVNNVIFSTVSTDEILVVFDLIIGKNLRCTNETYFYNQRDTHKYKCIKFSILCVLYRIHEKSDLIYKFCVYVNAVRVF